jgi:hypothetical protein
MATQHVCGRPPAVYGQPASPAAGRHVSLRSGQRGHVTRLTNHCYNDARIAAACSSTAVFWSGPARLHPIAFARAPSHCFETELGTVLVRPTGPTRLPWRTWTGVCDLVPAPPLAASATPSDSTGEHVLAGRPTGRPRLAVERR